MENENPWERKKTNPGIDQLLEDLENDGCWVKNHQRKMGLENSRKYFYL